MVVLLDVHVTVRSVTTLLAASRIVAVSCTVSPTSNVSLVGPTVMLAIGGGMTLMVATPLFEPLAAVIVAVPSAWAVTRPDPETDATLAADDDQVTGCPERMLPAASFTVALSCTVWPTCRDSTAGETSTVATTTSGSEEPPHATMKAPIISAAEHSRVTRTASVNRIIVVPLRRVCGENQLRPAPASPFGSLPTGGVNSH